MASVIESKMSIKQRDLIFGYIHEIEKLYKLNIPEPIILLFALFYISNAEWDLSILSNYIKVSGDNNEYVENMEDIDEDWKSIFGKRICCGYGKYEWNLEIVESSSSNNNWNIMVGIIKNDARFCMKARDRSAFEKFTSIGIVGSERGIVEWWIVNRKYGEKFEKVGDTIKVILDLDNLTLSYTINGTDYGPAIDSTNSYDFDLNKENEYRFALSLISGRKLRLY